MVKILSIDPGDTTGWVYAETNSETKSTKIIEMGEWKYGEVYRQLCSYRSTVDILVVEDYKIRDPKVSKGYSHYWSSPTPLRIIGACEFLAANFKVKLVLQQPSIKPMGGAYLGWKPGSVKKGEHTKDALMHLEFYCVTQLKHVPVIRKK